MEPMIQLKHISKTFGVQENAVAALHDVSIDINRGEIFGVIGLSGAGLVAYLVCAVIIPEKPDDIIDAQ